MKTEIIIENGIEYLVMTDSIGDQHWYLANPGDLTWAQPEWHREMGPAVIHANGSRFWYSHGDLHRVDGPACLWHWGAKEWYYQGEKIKVRSQKAFKKWLKLTVFQ